MKKRGVRYLWVGLVITLTAGFIYLPRPVRATTIGVNSFQDEYNVNDGDCTLREAIRAANTNLAVDGCAAGQSSVADEIVLPAGTFTLTIAGANENNNQTGDFDITQSVTITGAGRDATIIDGASLDRVFHVAGGANLAVTFRNLTIQNGCAGGGTCGVQGSGFQGGGGVEMNAPGTVTFEQIVVQGSRGNAGGGLHPYAATPNALSVILRDSIIRNNTAGVVGGGMSSHNLTRVERSVFENNSTTNGGNGGGLAIPGGVTTVVESEISNNTATGSGGGVTVQGFNNSNFGTLVMTNTTVSGNRAYIHGGGIHVNGGAGSNLCTPSSCSATLTNVTVAGNMADADNGGFMPGNGGGLFVNASAGTNNTPGILTMTNTIVSGNTDPTADASLGTAAPDCAGPITSNRYNIVGNTAGCPLGLQPNDQVADPLLAPLANNGGPTRTHALLAGSPALDAGAACPAADQRGAARPQGAACDIGAYELETAAPVCGNTVVEAGEMCDDGNTQDGDGCSAACQVEPPAPVCGNAVQEEGEACDDGNTDDTDACTSQCRAAICSDGITWNEIEECDDANSDNTDACTNQCLFAVCGDTYIQTGAEQCDDGNTQNGDGCSAQCQRELPPAPVCGNNVIEENEQCDDGNTADNDGCSAACQIEPPPVLDRPNLTVTTAGSAAYVSSIGQTITFTFTYRNLGAAPATGVVIRATAPFNATVSTTASLPTVWSCPNGTGASHLCTTAIPGEVPPGATGTVRFAVQTTGFGSLYQIAAIHDDGSHGADLDDSNNGATFIQGQVFRSAFVGEDRLTNTANPAGSPSNIANVLIPNAYDPASPAAYPAIMILHGLGGSAAVHNQSFGFGWSNGVNSRGYFLIMPNGTRGPDGRQYWNATDACCSTTFGRNPATDVNDADYLRRIITETTSRFHIDTTRVYSTGFSNGGFMSYRLACDFPNLIAAIAPLSAATHQNEAACGGILPVSVLHVHGTGDTLPFYDAPFDHDNDPNTAPIPDRTDMPGARQSVERWAAKAGCSLISSSGLPNVNFFSTHTRPWPLPNVTVGEGDESIRHIYQTGCQPGYDMQLWEAPLVGHSNNYSPVSADLLLNWLLTHSR